MHGFPRLARIFAALVLLAAPLAPAGAAAADRLVVLPFEVYNAPELEPLKPGLEAALASRLDGPGYAVEQAPEASPQDWTVRTTVTHLGPSYSLDAALSPPAGSPAQGTRSYRTVNAPEKLLEALEAVAEDLKAHLGRRLTPPARPPRAAGPAASATPPAPAPAGASENPLANPRVGAAVEGDAVGLVATDLEGDGIPEILVVTEEGLTAYRDTGEGFTKLWEAPVPPGIRPALASAADLDGNGRPEVFIAGMGGSQPVSQAMEWFGSALASKGDRISGAVKAWSRPEPFAVVAGPGIGKDLFDGSFRRLRWAGAGYEPAETLDLPAAALPVNLDPAPLGPDARGWAVTTQSDRLRLYDGSGEQRFESADPVKGSRVAMKGEERVRDYQDEDYYRVHGRTLSRLVGSEAQFVLFRNHGTLGRVFQRVAAFSHGQVLLWRWDGLTLVPVAEGPKVPGAFVDLAWDPARRGERLYALLVQTEGALFRKERHRILAYDLR